MPAAMALSVEAIVAMLVFSAASSSLLLINKLCLHALPAPSLISTLQFAVCSVFIVLLKASGITYVDGWEWAKVRPYLAYVGMFVATIYCNMKALQYSNVETLIVFRACCPMVVAVLDWGLMGRQLPSPRSAVSLVVLIAGAAGYVLSDAAFEMNGWSAYTWVGAYFFIISIEMVYGKHIVGPQLGFKSMWGPTLYTNTLSILPMSLIGLATHETDRVINATPSIGMISIITASCVVGVAISFTGWYCRSLITATCYTVLGVANKMLTVLVNILIWDKHASPAGIVALCVCLVGAATYQQAPLRDEEELAASGDKAAEAEAEARRRKYRMFGVGGAVGVSVFLIFIFVTTIGNQTRPMSPQAIARPQESQLEYGGFVNGSAIAGLGGKRAGSGLGHKKAGEHKHDSKDLRHELKGQKLEKLGLKPEKKEKSDLNHEEPHSRLRKLQSGHTTRGSTTPVHTHGSKFNRTGLHYHVVRSSRRVNSSTALQRFHQLWNRTKSTAGTKEALSKWSKFLPTSSHGSSATARTVVEHAHASAGGHQVRAPEQKLNKHESKLQKKELGLPLSAKQQSRDSAQPVLADVSAPA